MSRSKRLTRDEKDAINRKNAQKSTGPKTEEGKDASRQNSTKHGCRAAVVTPPDEDPELEQRLIAEWTAEKKPFTTEAKEAVAACARAVAMTRRTQRYHQDLLREQQAQGRGSALGLLTDPRAASLVLRYTQEARRAYRLARAEMNEVLERDRVAAKAAEDEAKTRASAAAKAAEAIQDALAYRARASAPPNEPDGSPCQDPQAHYDWNIGCARDCWDRALKMGQRSGMIKYEQFLGGDPVEPLPPNLEQFVKCDWI